MPNQSHERLDSAKKSNLVHILADLSQNEKLFEVNLENERIIKEMKNLQM